ncbi:MAG: hypothetical protein CL993_04575 [Euryarchaeota archaeon]|nr:hypothetical protein [Euryarchaeota archaeon]
MSNEYALNESINHPRRSLGNRYRTQALKFLELVDENELNLQWAEKNARQSVLHDFMNDENWKVLLKIIILTDDEKAVRALFEDFFTILGRNPEQLSQLDGINILDSAEKIFESTLLVDPLNPDIWWMSVGNSKKTLNNFVKRMKTLDLTDYRANILFSRRLERLRKYSHEDIFLELSRFILAQRPNNYEAWNELGRMYERRQEFDLAWNCYDQANTHYPRGKILDMFKDRMNSRLNGGQISNWNIPKTTDRGIFLDKMRSLATPSNFEITEVGDDINEIDKINILRSEGRVSEAFFLARKIALEGDEGALQLVNDLMEEMNNV